MHKSGMRSAKVFPEKDFTLITETGHCLKTKCFITADIAECAEFKTVQIHARGF